LFVGSLLAQPPGPPNFVPIGKAGPGGPMGGGERKLVKQFDKDSDGKLNKEERQAAREFLKNNRRGPGGRPPAKPGPKVSPADVKNFPDASFYDPTVLRTLFIDFEDADWETEMAEFHNTDVELPATLTVDGKKYPNVGVHFRGMSSFGGVGPGHKRSMGISLDHTDKKQRLYGYKTLNLLNSHDDPSHLTPVLYSHISRQYIPATKANLVRVVINGESWGIYPNVQQFNREFVEENFKTNKGTRWKVPGPGPGGLVYFGEKIENYKSRFEIKSADKEESWKALINLCKTLHETPPDKLESALRPIVDIDSLLWFLALDVALINGDGYWTRNSDYNLYLDEHGKFHFLPHDINEAFKPSMGPMGPPAAQRPSPPGDILPAFARDSLKLTDEQKQKVAALQKDVEAKLDALFTEEQKKNWKEIRNRPQPRGGMMMGGPGGAVIATEPPGPPAGPPAGGPPVARGPGGAPPPPPAIAPVPAGTVFVGGGDFFTFAGGRATSVELDPLVGLDDPQKPLRSKVLAVPSFRAKYLANIRRIADESLDWKKLGPIVSQLRSLIERDVEADTRKLDSFEAFKNATADDGAGPARGREFPLRAFADQRRKFLLDHPEVKKAAEVTQRGE
jgi:hypothetical protein